MAKNKIELHEICAKFGERQSASGHVQRGVFGNGNDAVRKIKGIIYIIYKINKSAYDIYIYINI